MRELEGQAVSDVSREVAGMRAESTGLFLLVRPREIVVKTKKRTMFFMMAVRLSGSRGADIELLIELGVAPVGLSFIHLLHFHY